MSAFLFRRRRAAPPVGAAEGQALMLALHRIRQQDDGPVRREADRVLRQVLVSDNHGEAARLARNMLHAVAGGPEPRAALIAARCWALWVGMSANASSRALG